MKAKQGLTIRPARISDADAICAILRQVKWLAQLKKESPADTKARVSRNLKLCADGKDHKVFVAENTAGTVAGYVAVHWLPYLILSGPEGYVSELFALENERGKGVGKKLLEAAHERAVGRGSSRLRLVTGRRRTSYKIYKRLGWKERRDIADFVLPL